MASDRPWHPEELARDATTVAELARAYSADTGPVGWPWPITSPASIPPGATTSLAATGFRGDQMREIGRVARDRFGLTVQEATGWTTRGRTYDTFMPTHVICHHTAMPYDVDRVLIEGRPDVPGPLCHFSLHADGTVVLIAAGLANHCGTATVRNAEAYGIEATGPVPVGAQGPGAFPQYGAYLKLCAAVRLVTGWGRGRHLGHKEIALPDGRKIDPAFGDPPPWPYADMDRFRDGTEQLMRGADDMPLSDEDIARIREEAVIKPLADPTHAYLQDELRPLKEAIAAISVTVSDAQLEALADRLAPLVAARLQIAGHPGFTITGEAIPKAPT